MSHERPTNVRIEHPDGTATRIELSYGGVDDDGYDVWKIATPMHRGDQLRIDVMPPHCVITGPTDGWWQ